ncbi:hypothetical protein GCK32_022003, partial [Trichostrongylus colubriformis]
VTLFAEDDHYCHTDDATTYFNTSATEPLLSSRVISKLPSSSSSLEHFAESPFVSQKLNSTTAVVSNSTDSSLTSAVVDSVQIEKTSPTLNKFPSIFNDVC